MFLKKQMISKLLMTAAVLFALCMLAGCQSGPYEKENFSLLERNWGRSFEAMKYNQTANPEAPENLEPVSGMDSRAAQNALENYRQGFIDDESGDSLNLNLGIGGTN